jgi:hypothetical protein
MYRCLLILLVACRSSSVQPHDDSKAASLDASAEREPSDDATSQMNGDAAIDAGYAGSDAGTPGVVSCYSEGNPTATCTLPTHCCFTNYSAQHNGACTSSACAWGTIDCDGPEDCSAGKRCCAHVLKDSTNELVGYAVACQQDPCGPTPLNEELCHPTTMASGTCSAGSCVGTVGYNNDLPRTLSICR